MKDSIKHDKEMIAKAICHYVALLDGIPDKLFQKLLPFINVNHLSDQELLANKRLKDHIDWNSFNNVKIIRLIIRDKSVMQKIDLKHYSFKLKELIPLFLNHPDLIDEFDLDFSKLGPIEAINMLEINAEFIDKIDLGKFTYDKLQLNQIVLKFSKHEKIIKKLNLTLLDHFSTRNLLIKTGNKYVDNLDLTKLKDTDWFEILKTKPQLLEHCNLSLFEKGDCYLLTKLVLMYPSLDYMIANNKHKISALGWENLICKEPVAYSQYCNFSIFSKKNWNNILRYHPRLIETKNKYML